MFSAVKGGAHGRGFIPHMGFNTQCTQCDLNSSNGRFVQKNSDCVPRVDLSVPKFVGREDPKAYLAWEKHCDYMFGVHRLSDA